jgi:two-component system chemotaxis response regulator CheB
MTHAGICSVNGPSIVVIGASAGGLEPIRELVSGVGDTRAALFAVLHGPDRDRSQLPRVVRDASSLPVRFAEDGDPIEVGHLLLAPPDRHLILGESRVRLTRGPHENLWRPSIDVLFRSAAVEHGPRTIGVVLSGALDDGTAGIGAICACGGRGLVQDPTDAAFPDMPASVLRNFDGVRVARVADLPATLLSMLDEPIRAPVGKVPEALKMESRFAEDPVKREADYSKLGKLSENTCPECGGPLRQLPDEPLRFRCHTGHAYSGLGLEEQTRQEIESSLWSAIRLFEQRSNIDRALAQKESERGRLRGADQYAMRAAEAQSHASVLHDLLMRLPD